MDDPRLGSPPKEEPGTSASNSLTILHSDMDTPGEPLAEPKHGEVTLKNFVIKCSPEGLVQHALDGMTVVIHGLEEDEKAHTEKIAPTTWKFHREIQVHSNMDEFMISVQSEVTGDVGYVAFSKDELAAFVEIDNTIEVERDFMSLEENGPLMRLSFTLEIASNVSDEHFFNSLENPEIFSAVIAKLEHPGQANYLGGLFYERSIERNSEDDTNKAILAYFRAIELISSDDANYGTYVRAGGLALYRRSQLSRTLPDLNIAISMMEIAITYTPEGHSDMADLLKKLGFAFTSRFERNGVLTDITSAISAHQRAIQLLSEDHTDMPSWLSNLGCSFTRRFEYTGDPADIASAINTHQKAVQLTPEGHSDMPGLLNNLGSAFQNRFERTGDPADIASAIFNFKKAVQLTPDGHKNMSSLIGNLGSSFQSNFKRTGDPADIASAITNHQSAVQLTPEGHEDLPSKLSNLGKSFLLRFERTGDLADIANVISTFQRVVHLTPEDHANMPSHLNSLGMSFQSRFKHNGDLADIASAISNHLRAVQLTPEGHVQKPSWLNNLGNSFARRFEHTGDLLDIANAISNHQKAVQLTPDGHALMPIFINSLGTSYMARFQRTGNLADISSAISNQQRTIQLSPEGHARMPSWLNNLGSSFASRFKHTGDLSDIANAISNHQKAVQLTPDEHADMAFRLSTLGKTFIVQFGHTDNLADITSAISALQRAVHLTPERHSGMSSRLNSLARSFSLRFTSTQDIEDIHQAISLYRRSATQIDGHPSTCLSAARTWARLSRIVDKSQSLEAFSVSIKLLPQVAGLEQTIHKRHQTLIDISDITASATAAGIDDDELETALAWLEQGRCLVWNQLNHLRTTAEDLRAHDPPLADRFLRVAHALDLSGSREERHNAFSEDNMKQMISMQDEVHSHVHLAKEWNELLSEIRSIPKFRDFLLPPQVSNLLSRLPPDGPIIIFNLHEDRCDALALIFGLDCPIHVPLKTFSRQTAIQLGDDLRQYLRDQDVRQRQEADRALRPYNPQNLKRVAIYKVLRELWEHVATPILDALAYSPHPPGRQPRIWWCPTGPLAFLPIHAAGIYTKEKGIVGPCVSDYVISSYTPTVSALLDKMKKPPTTDFKPTSLLIISQPSTPGQTPIPGAKQEAHALRDMARLPPNSLLLEDSSATVGRVKEEMKTHASVHFACHAVQDIAEPLKSGVQLHDGRLELLEMMKQTLPDADLAFLSACQTSTGDEKLSDEVVHLAAGMLAAGYRSVVATMWSIKDQYGPVIAEDFYTHILAANPQDRRLDGGNAAYALHYATQKIRKELGDTEEALLTWVPYVHFGV